ncbi:hypothetical protein MLD38_039533 [Melastoma candidum]|uniref:Uncharacterized protein n=1 Tax=Melastoma candidum TaxID=119954 RepID=A0ACB9L2Q3_9MYRT|nr:hypothetical protein MLD38_039533 [Melastoma candidum]
MAAAAYPIPLTAAQIGTYFVGQYYHALQQQPEIVHQFYSDSSTMLRVDGNSRETATGMLQIHTLIMSISYTGVEIKTIFSLESWNGGVLVMISGSVQPKNLNGCRKFAQTFFLAPQETGFFILNDIFHLIEEDHPHHLPPVFLAQHNISSKISTPHSNDESVPTYMVGGEIQAKDSSHSDVKENGHIDNCGVPERHQQVREVENGSCAVDSNGPAQNGGNDAADNLPTSAGDSVGDPPKHTYASILRVAKGQGPPSVASPPSAAKSPQTSSEWDPVPEVPSQQSLQSSNEYSRAGGESEDVSTIEEEGEVKSVHVRNLPPSVSESEIEREFEKFGKIRPNGLVIRGRKDLGVCYAFVEFEDMRSVNNAVKAGSAHIGGREVFIEERRPNSNIPSRGRRGRARGPHQVENSGGRFGSRSLGKVGGYSGGDREHTKPRGNGFYRPSHRQDRTFAGRQSSRGNPNEEE